MCYTISMVHIGNSWDELLQGEWEQPYYKALRAFLVSEYRSQAVCPPMNDIFNAFKYCAYEDVKVVILGQDPYHGPSQAHGLCFSVQKGIEVPPSLKNIYKELSDDIGFIPPEHGYLEKWARQGVFLLNTTLTVRQGHPLSHKGQGWETFTDHVIQILSRRERPMVFLLWGSNARSKASLIDTSRHLVLQAPHPSPLSAYAGFFGCRHFSKANAFLSRFGESVDWSLE